MASPMTRRGFLSGSILFVGGVALSACSTGDPLGKSTSTAAPAGSGAPKITLNHWYHEYGEEGTQQAAMKYAADFTKANPDIAVKVSWIPGDYGAKWKTAVLTPDGPDVYEVNAVDPTMVQAGQVTPLDDVIGAEKSDFNAKTLEAYTWGGMLYAIPMIIDPLLVFYNKGLLAKAGVAVPTTFAELVAAAQKLTTGKQKGLFLGNNGLALQTVLPWSNGNMLIDDREIIYSDPAVVEVLTAYKQLYNTKFLLRDFTTDWWDPGAIISGATAMQLLGMWAVPGMIDELGEENVGAFPLPAFKSGAGRQVVYMGGWVQVVNGKSKQIEAAKKYVRWLWVENAQVQEDWNLGYGFHIPPRASTAAKATKLQSGPAKEVLDLVAQHGVKEPALWTPEVRKPYEDAVLEIMSKGDPAKILQGAAKQSQEILDKVPTI